MDDGRAERELVIRLRNLEPERREVYAEEDQGRVYKMKIVVKVAFFLSWLMSTFHALAGLGFFLYQIMGGGVDYVDASLGLLMFASGISAAILFFLKRKFFLALAAVTFIAYSGLSLYDWSVHNLHAWKIALAWGLLNAVVLSALLVASFGRGRHTV